MRQYHFTDFHENDAWLIFRVDTQVQEQPVDIYMVMDLPGGEILTLEIIEIELSHLQADELLKRAHIEKGCIPRRILLAKGDPAELSLKDSAIKRQIYLESVPAVFLEALVIPFKESFGQNFFSPSSWSYDDLEDDTHVLEDKESAKKMVPDSYDPCPCASGKKYKFCCKKIFREIVEAMVAAEEGQLSEALKWINKAKAIAGETAEVLCREAIVYSFFDSEKSQEILNKCLTINPKHPRAHYIRGIEFKEKGDFLNAIVSYEMAIANYPESDHFHLNETYNNLGSVFHAIGDLTKAKSAWEKALLFLPSDKIARDNLATFIYNRPI